jgi:hypothetical protein
MRSALRKNNDSHIEQILRTNSELLKRTSPPRNLAETAVQCSEPNPKTRMNSMDLERQILNVTPPEFSNQKPNKSHFDVMSQEMGVFDSQESQPDNIQEKDYQLIVAQMLDNPKVDKKMMLNVFLNQMQMSGDLPQNMHK